MTIQLRGNRRLFLVTSVCVALFALLLTANSLPSGRRTLIPLVWLLIVPVSYSILAEQNPHKVGLFQLPGVPVGSSWDPSPPRPRARATITRRGRATRDLRRVLKRLGYSPDRLENSDVDMVARSPEGKNVVVKVVEGQAGVLACQDAMKAMLDSGAREAIVLAPEGSTSTARRFVRKIRSRKGLRIHIWNSPHSAEAQMRG